MGAYDPSHSPKRRPSGTRFLSHRNPPTTSASRARMRIAHVQATAGDIEAVEMTVDCPSCGQAILVETEEAFPLGGVRDAANADAQATREKKGEGSIADVMREAPWVVRTAAVSALVDIFEATRSPAIVVVDAERRPLGVATPVDIFAEIGSRGPVTLAGVGLEDLATSPVLYLRSDTRLSSALRLYMEQKPECIVVLSDSGKLMGLVTAAELLRFLATA